MVGLWGDDESLGVVGSVEGGHGQSGVLTSARMVMPPIRVAWWGGWRVLERGGYFLSATMCAILPRGVCLV